MRALLISDVHAAGRSCPRQQALVTLLSRVRCDVLVLAGDVFQRWADDGQSPHPEVAPVVDALSRVPARLVFTPGNHDHAAGRFFEARLGAEVAPVVQLVVDGLRVRVSHGDEADASLGYRALAWALRNPAFEGLCRALGPERVWSLQATLDHPPRGAPDPRLVAAQRARAIDVLGRGEVDLVVNGHTHAPGLEALPGGAWMNLGDGVAHRTLGWIEDATPQVLPWDALPS